MIVPRCNSPNEPTSESPKNNTERPILQNAHNNKVYTAGTPEKCNVKEDVIEFQDLRSECTALSELDIKIIQNRPSQCNKNCSICCMDNAIMNLVFELMFVTFIVLALKKKYLYFLGSAMSGMMLLFDFISSDILYFLHKAKFASEKAVEIINSIKNSSPKITWMIQCYHIDRIINKCTAPTLVRINTTSAKHIVRLKAANDVTDYGALLSNIFTKNCMIYIEKSFTFNTPEDASNFEALKQYFIATNKKDVFYDFQEFYEIDGFKPKMLSFINSNYSKLLSFPYLVLFSLLGFSWLYRIINYVKCYKANIQLNKVISL
jgi:hypothetical protein